MTGTGAAANGRGLLPDLLEPLRDNPSPILTARSTAAETSMAALCPTEQEIARRLLSPGFDRWAEQAASTGHCARPVRLRGHATTLDRRTGEVLSRYDSSAEPDGVLYKRCGNRRASVCPSCSHEYKGDMWHLLAAGAAGGMKGVPASVAAHPLVFVTLTAPSFGAVHTTRRGRDGVAGRCRPRSGHRKRVCAHGRPAWCGVTHDDGDRRLGQPLCPGCYDYRAHVVWQWWAPELWRRFTIGLQRALAARLGVTATALRRLVRVSFAKVAEFQRRAVVHFHALVRLDGPASAATEDDPLPAPLVDVPAVELVALIRAVADRVRVDAPPTGPGDPIRRLAFGVQVDGRPVSPDCDRDTDRSSAPGSGQLHPETVAAYIAKYATKGCEDFGLPPRLRDPDMARRMGVPEHVCRLLAEVRLVATGGVEAYARMIRWVPMLGFRGHFATKSRRYSTTLGRLRSARRRWQLRKLRTQPRDGSTDAAHGSDTDDGEDSTLVIGSWSLDGIGWLTGGDAALAATAAAQAREWADRRATGRRFDRESASIR